MILCLFRILKGILRCEKHKKIITLKINKEVSPTNIHLFAVFLPSLSKFLPTRKTIEKITRKTIEKNICNILQSPNTFKTWKTDNFLYYQLISGSYPFQG